MNFWSVKNVQKYNYKSVFINCQESLCHAALEVLRVHYLNGAAKKYQPMPDPNFEFSACQRTTNITSHLFGKMHLLISFVWQNAFVNIICLAKCIC